MADSNILKILLVDDEEPFRKVVGDFLNSTNLYVTYFCESGEEAIVLISQNRFDVILLDYKMAGVSG
ncbi:MAG: response regulator, partial [Bacteroidetes bacterium]|nr:response regulator [Bacteroidota bacterium]MBU1423303.1 response regulator [Bacteroidota bacterium]